MQNLTIEVMLKDCTFKAWQPTRRRLHSYGQIFLTATTALNNDTVIFSKIGQLKEYCNIVPKILQPCEVLVQLNDGSMEVDSDFRKYDFIAIRLSRNRKYHTKKLKKNFKLNRQ